MRVTMQTGQTVTSPDGVETKYSVGLTFNVDDALARDWIREGYAVDEDGRVDRLDLLSDEEAVEVGLVAPEPAPEPAPVPEPEPTPDDPESEPDTELDAGKEE